MTTITIESLAHDIKHTRKTVDSLSDFVKTEFELVKGKQDKTNGRVLALETDKIVRDAQLVIYRRVAIWMSGVSASVIASVSAGVVLLLLRR